MALPPFLPLALAAMRKAHAPASEEDLKADEARREAELQLAEDKREQQLVSQIVEDAEQADYDDAAKEHGEIYATPDLRNQAYIASRAAIGGQGVGALEAAGMPRVFAPERAIAEEATLGAAIGKGLGMGLKAASGLIGRRAAKEGVKEGAEKVAKQITSAPDFKTRFGSSKITTDGDTPLLMYHGSPKSFENFDPKTIGTHGRLMMGKGFYFSPSYTKAENFVEEGGRMYTAALRMENPFDYTAPADLARWKKVFPEFVPPKSRYTDDPPTNQDMLRGFESYLERKKSASMGRRLNEKQKDALFFEARGAALRELDYDGIIWRMGPRPEDAHYLVFDADQIILPAAKEVAEQVPVFYSHLDEVAGGMKQNVGVNDVEKFFLGKGVKKGELRDLDIEGLVSSAKAQGKKSLSQDEIVEHVAKNRRQLEDVRLGQQSPEQLAAAQKRNEAFKPVRAQLEEDDLDPDFVHQISTGNKAEFNDVLYARLETPLNERLEGLYREIAEDQSLLSDGAPAVLKNARERVAEITRPTNVFAEFKEPYPLATTLVADKGDALIAFYKELLVDPEYRRHLQKAHDFNMSPKSKGVYDPTGEAELRPSLDVFNFDRKMRGLIGLTLPDAGPLARNVRDIRALEKVQQSPELKAFFRAHEETEAAMQAGVAKAPGFSQWVADGSEHPAGKNYQEMLITSPSRAGKIIDDPDVKELQETIRRHQSGVRGGLRGSDLNEKATFAKISALQDKVVAKYPDLDPIPKNPRLKSISFPNEKGGALHLWDTAIEDLKKSAFTESHHGSIPDVMLHIRTTDRIDDQGRRVLFVDEIQSDWHQQGRQAGYKQSPEEVSRLNDEYKELLGKKIEARNKFDRAKENVPGPLTSLDGASPEAQEIVRLHDEFDSISDAADEAKRVMERARNGLPSTSHQKTEEWLPLAVRRVLRRASDEGYDAVAFTSGDLASSVVSMPEASATVFYDQKLPGVLKREVGIPKKQDTEEFFFDFGDGQETMAGVSLTPELKKKLSGPQKLYSAIPLAAGVGAAAGATQDEDKSLEDKRMEAIRRAMSE